jgi:ParB family chromosome partitioning protein
VKHRDTLPIAEIKIGPRFRKDMGDVGGLAENIAAVGLLHPVVVRPDKTLIAGERRIVACKQLGWPSVPVTVVDLDTIVRGEYAENAFRKNLTLSEAVAVKRALEPIERAAAKARQAEGGKSKGKASAKLAEARGEARDKIAKLTGTGRTNLRQGRSNR